MIILALLGAIIFYAVIFLFYASARGQLSSVQGVLQLLNDMIWRPDDTIFLILHSLIAITLLYLFFDWLRAFIKSYKRRREELLAQSEKPELKRKEIF